VPGCRRERRRRRYGAGGAAAARRGRPDGRRRRGAPDPVRWGEGRQRRGAGGRGGGDDEQRRRRCGGGGCSSGATRVSGEAAAAAEWEGVRGGCNGHQIDASDQQSTDNDPDLTKLGTPNTQQRPSRFKMSAPATNQKLDDEIYPIIRVHSRGRKSGVTLPAAAQDATDQWSADRDAFWWTWGSRCRVRDHKRSSVGRGATNGKNEHEAIILEHHRKEIGPQAVQPRLRIDQWEPPSGPGTTGRGTRRPGRVPLPGGRAGFPRHGPQDRQQAEPASGPLVMVCDPEQSHLS